MNTFVLGLFLCRRRVAIAKKCVAIAKEMRTLFMISTKSVRHTNQINLESDIMQSQIDKRKYCTRSIGMLIIQLKSSI